MVPSFSDSISWFHRAFVLAVCIVSASLLWSAIRRSLTPLLGLRDSPRASEGEGVLRRLESILATSIVFWAILVVVAMGLGALGLLDSSAALTLALLSLLVSSGLVSRRARSGRAPSDSPDSVSSVPRDRFRDDFRERSISGAGWSVLAGLILLFAVKWGQPPSSWDALTYHLNNPAHWVVSGNLETLHQSTGDTSNTYYPIAAECLYALGLVATGSDWWVPFAQMPAALIGCLSVAGLAIFSGSSRRAAIAGSLLWISTPVLFRQVSEAENDVWLSAWLLSSTYFCIALARSGKRVHLVLALAAAGLAAGTKFIGLVYCAVPGLLVLSILWRQRSLRLPEWRRALVVGVIVAFGLGGFSYVRNAVSTGNPFAPMRVSLSGREVLPGFVDSSVFFASTTRNVSPRDMFLSVRAAADAGAGLLATVAGLAVAVVVVSRRSGGASRRIAWGALASAAVFMLLIPHRQHRLAVYVCGMAIPLAARTIPTRAMFAAIVLNLGVASLYVVKDVVFSPAVFGWSPWTTALAIGIGAAAAAAWGIRRMPRTGSLRLAATAAAAACIIVVVALQRDYEGRRFENWQTKWGNQRARAKGFSLQSDRRDWASCWRQVGERTRDRRAVVAFAGTNLPYPLRGPRVRNEVLHVPRTESSTGPYFDWGLRAYDPSGQPDPSAWLERVRARGVDLLCLFREESAEWPPEESWASEHPETFESLWSAEYAMLFRVRKPVGEGAER